MTVREAFESPHESCPEQVCSHGFAIMGRKICTFSREALCVVVTQLARERKKEQDQALAERERTMNLLSRH